ncbi:MAG: hypothetical protein H7Y38_12145 [Armatimonadetes bacterium]|nr:hypothetical protein [Armatimonadota bacterium]
MFTNRTQNQSLSFIKVTTVALASILVTGAVAQAQGLTANPNDLRDAFAKHPSQANSPQAFAQFVSQNQSLSQRYSRHFNVPQDRLVSFFKTSLVAYKLPEARTLTTYGVTKSGAIYPVEITLPKGTPVWATREGVPVLKWNCSNPLASILPGAALNTPALEYASAPSPLKPISDAPQVSLPDTFGMTTASSLPEESFTGSSVAVAPLADAGFAFAVPTGTADSASLPGIGEIVDAGAKSFNPANLLPGLLLIPAIMGAVGGGSDAVFSGESDPVLARGTGESAPVMPMGGGESTPVIGAPVVVPEGDTAGLLLAGLPLLTGAVWLSRRRKTA